MQCKYCKNEVLGNANFCSNCGSIIDDTNKNVFLNTLKNIAKGVINPNSFIRNSKIFDLGKTGIISGLIILLILGEALLFSNSTTGKISSLFLEGGSSSILYPLVMVVINIAISSLVIYAVISIKKIETSYLQVLNFEIYTYLFVSLFQFITGIFNLMSIYFIALIIVTYGSILYSLIFMQGIKSIWKQDTKWSVFIYVLQILTITIVKVLVNQVI